MLSRRNITYNCILLHLFLPQCRQKVRKAIFRRISSDTNTVPLNNRNNSSHVTAALGGNGILRVKWRSVTDFPDSARSGSRWVTRASRPRESHSLGTVQLFFLHCGKLSDGWKIWWWCIRCFREFRSSYFALSAPNGTHILHADDEMCTLRWNTHWNDTYDVVCTCHTGVRVW